MTLWRYVIIFWIFCTHNCAYLFPQLDIFQVDRAFNNQSRQLVTRILIAFNSHSSILFRAATPLSMNPTYGNSAQQCVPNPYSPNSASSSL